MSNSTEIWNLVLNAVTLFIGVVGGIVCWFWSRPADKKLKHLEALLTENNSRIDIMRSALVESCVRNDEAKYNRVVESCIHVYRAFQQITSVFGVMCLCRGLKDIGEIRKNLSYSPSRARFADWLMAFLPKEEVSWKHPDVVTVADAEIFVPANVWNTYRAMTLLVGSLQLQIASLGLDMDSDVVDVEDVYRKVDRVLPGQYALLKDFGTMWYSNAVESLRKKMIAEIRKVSGVDPVNENDLLTIDERIGKAFAGNHGVPAEFRVFQSGQCVGR